MPKARLNTTIDENLMKLLKDKASLDEIKNINVIIEKALKFYFANLSVSVWEIECPGGWIRKLTIRPNMVIVENIRSRKSTKNYEKAYYSNDAMLEKDGWKRIWKLQNKDST